MHGNVCEWCLDRFGDYSGGAVTDPVGAQRGTHHVLRGGWYLSPFVCRSAFRQADVSSFRDCFLGLRLAPVSSAFEARLKTEREAAGRERIAVEQATKQAMDVWSSNRRQLERNLLAFLQRKHPGWRVSVSGDDVEFDDGWYRVPYTIERGNTVAGPMLDFRINPNGSIVERRY